MKRFRSLGSLCGLGIRCLRVWVGVGVLGSRLSVCVRAFLPACSCPGLFIPAMTQLKGIS